MAIVNTAEPIIAIYNMIKSLYSDIPIYKEVMSEDENDIPDSYILLRSDVDNNADIYGDGVARTRESDCDIMLISKGMADSTSDLHNINLAKIKKILKQQGINYSLSNLGYDDVLKSTQHTFSLVVKYIG